MRSIVYRAIVVALCGDVSYELRGRLAAGFWLQEVLYACCIFSCSQ
jgi:hypothetical protein